MGFALFHNTPEGDRRGYVPFFENVDLEGSGRIYLMRRQIRAGRRNTKGATHIIIVDPVCFPNRNILLSNPPIELLVGVDPRQRTEKCIYGIVAPSLRIKFKR